MQQAKMHILFTSTAIHCDQHHSNSQDWKGGPLHGRQVLAQKPDSKQCSGHYLEALRTNLEGNGIQMRGCHDDQHLRGQQACLNMHQTIAVPDCVAP